MIFVSINPFQLRRFYCAVFILILLSCISCFGESLLVGVSSTPYDQQMNRIRPVLTESSHSGQSQVSLRLVNSWIGDLRSIPYGFTAAWKTPNETESGAPADCKAKAVDLYLKMKEHGAANVRLVIGRRTPSSRSTHAWVEWDTPTGSYVLDPTINWMAYRAEEISRSSYVRYYAYAGNRKYRATTNTLLASN
jgi:predicted transglutaminase-like cysteine proteinase